MIHEAPRGCQRFLHFPAGPFFCASCSNASILSLRFPAGPPDDPHWKGHKVQRSWAPPRQINNVNVLSVGEKILPAISAPLIVLNIHPLLSFGAGESGRTPCKSRWILEHQGTWGRRRSNQGLVAQGKKTALVPLAFRWEAFIWTRKEGGAVLSPCWARTSARVCGPAVHIMHVPTRNL